MCMSGGETLRGQVGELRAKESQSLIAKDLKELRTCAIGQTDRFALSDAGCASQCPLSEEPSPSFTPIPTKQF